MIAIMNENLKTNHLKKKAAKCENLKFYLKISALCCQTIYNKSRVTDRNISKSAWHPRTNSKK